MNGRLWAVAAVAGAAVTLLGCSSDSDRLAKVDVDVGTINDLVTAANQDAKNMEGHADTMTSLVSSRPDHAHWENDADTARANARSVRFLADSAAAIARDQALFPAKASAVDLGRLLGNGLNLQALGDMLLKHADAMDAHAKLMRQDAAGDARLIAVIDLFSADVGAMRSDAQTAIAQGKTLAETARTIARSTGVKVE